MPLVQACRSVALLLLLLVLSACDDGVSPGTPEGRVLGVVLNSVDISLTTFDAEDPGGSSPGTVGLAADGSPASMAVRGRWAAVPLGTVPAVAIVDLATLTLVRTVALPAGSGATGVAFINDSIVVVANPARNSVSPVNVRSGEAGPEVSVGGYPQAIVVSGDRVFAVNAELGPDFLPAGPGTLTALDRETLAPEGTVTLSGVNPGSVAVGVGGRLHVVLSGSFGAGNGSLSVVDPGSLQEVAHHESFGEFPFAAAIGPSGRLHVASFGYGLAIWDPATETFVRTPDDAVTPEGIPSTSGLAFDPEGRLYTLRPECGEPGAAVRLSGTYDVELTVPVGTCPLTIAFTTVED